MVNLFNNQMSGKKTPISEIIFLIILNAQPQRVRVSTKTKHFQLNYEFHCRYENKNQSSRQPTSNLKTH